MCEANNCKGVVQIVGSFFVGEGASLAMVIWCGAALHEQDVLHYADNPALFLLLPGGLEFLIGKDHSNECGFLTALLPASHAYINNITTGHQTPRVQTTSLLGWFQVEVLVKVGTFPLGNILKDKYANWYKLTN